MTTSCRNPASPRALAMGVGPLRVLLLLAACWSGAGCQTTGSSGAKSLASKQRSPAAQRQFEDSVRALEEGRNLGVVDWDLMARKFEAVVEEDEDHAEAWFNLGVIAERRGKPEEAVRAYERAIAAKPLLFVARENLGVLLENQGDPLAASEQYKEILRESPEHAGARARLAGIFFDGKDNGRALELAREALLRDPKNILAQKIMMKVYAARGEVDLARLVALRAMQLDAADPELPYLLGQALEQKGEEAAAMAQYRRSYELSADFLPARARLASAALERHSYEEAASLYEGIVRAEPSSAVARLNLGTALYGKGEIDEALASFQEAQTLDPNDTRPSYSIAVILHRSKDQPEEAIAYYRRFLAGSAINLPGSHPVFALMRECEQLIQLKEETRLAEEAAKAAEERRNREELEAAAAAAEEARAREAGPEPLPTEERPAEAAGQPAKGEAAPKPAAKVAPMPSESVKKEPAKAPVPKGVEIDPDEPEDDF